jgi:hypothetical protein
VFGVGRIFLLWELWLRFLEGLGMTMDDRAGLKIVCVSKLTRCFGEMGMGRMHTCELGWAEYFGRCFRWYG